MSMSILARATWSAEWDLKDHNSNSQLFYDSEVSMRRHHNKHVSKKHMTNAKHNHKTRHHNASTKGTHKHKHH